MKQIALGFALLFTVFVQSQSISDLINEVSMDSLQIKIKEFSGDIPTNVNGTTVSITNRVSSLGNDLAADYLFQKLSTYENLTVTNQVYSSGGRNVIAVQEGKTNPNDIYIICGHYDSVANYCADDNASGTTAVLEAARILSTQCLDNTIIYALWDQEEVGLVGANFYATQAANNGDNILAVLNLDMMAYDGDGDNDFDIDVNDFGDSLAMKDDIINVLNTYSFNLNVNVVNPGTYSSDHSRFWSQGYSAVLLGEAWSENDETPDYHTSDDRFDTLNMPYFFEMTKLVIAYMATKGGLLSVNNEVTLNTSTGTLAATQTGAAYQWINCDTDTNITGETSQIFTPTTAGNYAVSVTIGSCTEISECRSVNLLTTKDQFLEAIKMYPNPAQDEVHIQLPTAEPVSITILDINGKQIKKQFLQQASNAIDITNMSSGMYFVNFRSKGKTVVQKLIKQ